MADSLEQSLIRTRAGYDGERRWHRFQLDAYTGGGGGGITTVLVIYGCSEALLGYTPEFEWNFALMTGSVLGTMAIVTIAAWFPAWNASKINPVEHLTYE